MMENNDLQGLVKIKDYHVEAAKKMVAYAQAEGMRPNDKKHYEKRAKEHLEMVDVLRALIHAAPAPTTVDLANADADGFRNGRASVVVELPAEAEIEDFGDESMASGYNTALSACRDAIIAAGGRVKDGSNG